MNLKQLKQFVVLAETLSFRSAAARLNISQPPLSISIRQLETEIGQKLFERSASGVNLTAVGRTVLEHARRTLYHADQFRHAAQLVAEGQIGSLRVSFVASSTIRLLPRSIAHFRARYPLVELRLSEAGTNSIMTSLRDGLTDVGIVRYPTPKHPSVMTTLVERNHYLAALPMGHPKARRTRLRLSDLREDPFIMPSPVEGSAAYMSMMFACQHAGFSPHIVQEASQAQTIMALVEGGLGVALIPNVWKKLAPRAIAFKELTGMPKNEIGLAFACRNEEKDAALLRGFRLSVEAAAKLG